MDVNETRPDEAAQQVPQHRKSWSRPVVIQATVCETNAHVTNFTDGSSGVPYGS
jgi:hypothetical protein